MTEPPAPPETAPPLDLEGLPPAPWVFFEALVRGALLLKDRDGEIFAEVFEPEVGEGLVSMRAEVARLRGLLERIVDLDRTHFDPGSGGCPFCGIKVSWNEHDTDCPWPELEAAVLSWRKP